MATFNFIFRPSSCINQPGSISLRLTHRRQSISIVLPIKLYAHQWDKKSKSSNDEVINRQLLETSVIVNRILAGLDEQEEYSVDQIALRFRCQTKGDNLLEFVQQLSNICEKCDQSRTAKAYLSASRRLIAFCPGKKLSIKDITAPLMEKFERGLQMEGLTPNTISFYLRNLRSIYNKAVEMQKIVRSKISPFAHVFTGTEKTRKRALNQKDINVLYNVDVCGKQNLDFARKLFFFGFHACGMSFVDMAYLKKEDIKKNIIRYRRKKTGKIIELRITKELQKLIDYFYRFNLNSPYLLPILKDANKDKRLQYESALRLQNKRLKALGDLSALQDSLSTHVCRHSWASLARNLNIPLPVISESLGHSDEKTTFIYLASFDRRILDRASEQVSGLIKLNKNRAPSYACVKPFNKLYK